MDAILDFEQCGVQHYYGTLWVVDKWKLAAKKLRVSIKSWRWEERFGAAYRHYCLLVLRDTQHHSIAVIFWVSV